MRPVAMNARHGRREAALQGSGLVRAVGTYVQRRVPWAIATARDALSNDQCESAARFERPAKQALVLATESFEQSEGRGLFFFIPISSPFKQSENVAIVHLIGARGVACYEGCGLCNRFNPCMRTVLMGNLAQAG